MRSHAHTHVVARAARARRSEGSAGELVAGEETIRYQKLGRQLEADLRLIDLDWLRDAAVHCGCEGLYETNLWAGNGGGCTPCHYDNSQNFLCQITGRKRLLLFSPAHYHLLYPYPASHPMSQTAIFSMVDVEKPDTRRFPAFARAGGLETMLAPMRQLFGRP